MNKKKDKTEQKYIPEFGIIEVTLACNFNCLHCGSKAGSKRKDELSLDEIKILLKDLKSLGCKSISLMGGEILLRKDWLEIAKSVTDLGINCGIMTNGYLITEEKVKKMKDINVKNLGVSLDGACPQEHDSVRGVKGSFEKVIETVSLSAKYNILPTVITTVNKKNKTQLSSIFNLLLTMDKFIDWKIEFASCHENKFSEKYKIDEKDFIEVAEFISNTKNTIKTMNLKVKLRESHDIGYCSSIYNNLSKEFSQEGCLGGIKNFGIQSNGNVKGCLALQDEFIEGNIRERSFIDIWNDPDKFSITRKFKKSLLEGFCKDCEKALSETCKGGCRDFSQSVTGSIYNTPFCLFQSFEKKINA